MSIVTAPGAGRQELADFFGASSSRGVVCLGFVRFNTDEDIDSALEARGKLAHRKNRR